MTAPTSSSSVIPQRVVVSVADVALAQGEDSIISTFSLGTCIGVVLYDPKNLVGGLLHFMLPDSTLSPEKASKRPAMFADTGVEALIQLFKGAGGDSNNAKVLIAGGATIVSSCSHFKIGEKNVEAVCKLLKKARLSIQIEDVGGVNNRTIHFTLRTGEVLIKTPHGTKTLSLL